MRLANIGLRGLICTFSPLLLAALGGCHWGLFGSDNSGSAPSAPAASYSVGGTVSGLAAGGMFTLLDNGADSVSVTANGAFAFATVLPAGAGYAVSTGTEPTGQTCTISGGSGTIDAANVTGIVAACADQTFMLGGTIQGLSASGLVLANGSNTLAVPSGAQSFTLPTSMSYASSYNVTVQSQPAGLVCVVSAGSGTMPANAVTSVAVSCSVQTYTISGTVTGLNAITGLVLANGAYRLAVPVSATQFTLPGNLGLGAQYNVTIAGKPLHTTCTLTNGSGIIAANVTNVVVTCKTWVESSLYSIAGPPGDGALPMGSLLLAKDGNFYGMTLEGGAFNTAGISVDGGTVFKITPAGVETSLWSFGGANDGAGPFGNLIQGSDGNLYGMTAFGGVNKLGTVFRITPAGVETVLWSFGGVGDGIAPNGTLVEGSDGNFYGLTVESYAQNPDGAVFKITPAGVESVLWTFGNGTDGQFPYGNLVLASDGSFYGMTAYGGTYGAGTIFRVTPAGVETVVWSFGGTGDGADPAGSLTRGSDGNYYGMTYAGGANGVGTVFKVAASGTESVIHSFDTTDGASPSGDLLLGADGNFYGMSQLGGDKNFGAIFQITPTGAVTVLWSFADAAPTSPNVDGDEPHGNLVVGPDGALYGMTSGGGNHEYGAVISIR